MVLDTTSLKWKAPFTSIEKQRTSKSIQASNFFITKLKVLLIYLIYQKGSTPYKEYQETETAGATQNFMGKNTNV